MNINNILKYGFSLFAVNEAFTPQPKSLYSPKLPIYTIANPSEESLTAFIFSDVLEVANLHENIDMPISPIAQDTIKTWHERLTENGVDIMRFMYPYEALYRRAVRGQAIDIQTQIARLHLECMMQNGVNTHCYDISAYPKNMPLNYRHGYAHEFAFIKQSKYEYIGDTSGLQLNPESIDSLVFFSINEPENIILEKLSQKRVLVDSSLINTVYQRHQQIQEKIKHGQGLDSRLICHEGSYIRQYVLWLRDLPVLTCENKVLGGLLWGMNQAPLQYNAKRMLSVLHLPEANLQNLQAFESIVLHFKDKLEEHSSLQISDIQIHSGHPQVIKHRMNSAQTAKLIVADEIKSEHDSKMPFLPTQFISGYNNSQHTAEYPMLTAIIYGNVSSVRPPSDRAQEALLQLLQHIKLPKENPFKRQNILLQSLGFDPSCFKANNEVMLMRAMHSDFFDIYSALEMVALKHTLNVHLNIKLFDASILNPKVNLMYRRGYPNEFAYVVLKEERRNQPLNEVTYENIEMLIPVQSNEMLSMIQKQKISPQNRLICLGGEHFLWLDKLPVVSYQDIILDSWIGGFNLASINTSSTEILLTVTQIGGSNQELSNFQKKVRELSEDMKQEAGLNITSTQFYSGFPHLFTNHADAQKTVLSDPDYNQTLTSKKL